MEIWYVLDLRGRNANSRQIHFGENGFILMRTTIMRLLQHSARTTNYFLIEQEYSSECPRYVISPRNCLGSGIHFLGGNSAQLSEGKSMLLRNVQNLRQLRNDLTKAWKKTSVKFVNRLVIRVQRRVQTRVTIACGKNITCWSAC